MKDSAEKEHRVGPFNCVIIDGSLGQARSNDDYTKMADLFLEKHKSLANVAKLPDKEYVEWFKGVVEHAQKNIFPIAYSDFFTAQEWQYMNGEPLKYPPFTPTAINKIPDDDLMEFEVSNGEWRYELKEVIEFPYVKPSREEIVSKIRQAYREKKELIAHDDSAGWQSMAIMYKDAEKIKELEHEVHLKMPNGEIIILRDLIELFVWAPGATS